MQREHSFVSSKGATADRKSWDAFPHRATVLQKCITLMHYISAKGADKFGGGAVEADKESLPWGNGLKFPLSIMMAESAWKNPNISKKNQASVSTPCWGMKVSPRRILTPFTCCLWTREFVKREGKLGLKTSLLVNLFLCGAILRVLPEMYWRCLRINWQRRKLNLFWFAAKWRILKKRKAS
jgi:hypothetical protein